MILNLFNSNILQKFNGILFLLIFFCPVFTQAQGFQTEFGKNRVQYHDFEWTFYESENFIVYFYQGGQDLAKYALRTAEAELSNTENKLEHQLREKVELMVYHNISDIRQTNIGQSYEWANPGGKARFAANKIFVYFNGDHDHLRKQIVKGVSKVHFESLLFGSGIQEIVQNALLLNLPEWFTEGLIAYITEDWNTELDDQLRKMSNRPELKKLNKLDTHDAEFVGHSIWQYISQYYGPAAIPNILYLTRINRSVDSGFIFVLGSTVDQLVEEWWEYVQEMSVNNDINRDSINAGNLILQSKKKDRDTELNRIEISPNGKQLVYSTNENGLIKVFLKDLETGQKKRILKTGFRSYNLPTEAIYPLMAWNKRGTKLGIIYEKRDLIRFKIIDVKTGENQEAFISKFQQVLDFDFTNDDRTIVLSAVNRSQADLFKYFIPTTKITQLTNDYHDDIDISFAEIAGRKGIVFSSNRPNDTMRLARFDTILPQRYFDLYFYDLAKPYDPLIRLTETKKINERNAGQINDKYICYQSDLNGIHNKFALTIDSVYIKTDTFIYSGDSIWLNPQEPIDSSFLIDSIKTKDLYKLTGISEAISNYNSNISSFTVAKKADKTIELLKEDGVYSLYEKSTGIENYGKIKLKNTPYKNLLKKRMAGIKDSLTTEQKPDDNTIKTIVDSTLIGPVWDQSIFENIEIDSTDKSDEIDIENYFFQSEFDFLENKKNEVESEASILERQAKELAEKQRVRLSRVRAYSVKFSLDYMLAQFNNSVSAFDAYQSLEFEPAGNFNPNLKGFLLLGISDLFEDYKVTGGVRLSFAGINPIEYYVNFRNQKKQLDKIWTYYRKTHTFEDGSFSNTGVPNKLKVSTNFIQYGLAYPLDITSRVAFHAGYRQYKKEYLSSSEYLDKRPELSQWLQLKLEYVFDNTLKVDQNVFYGTRYKFYAEFHKPFSAVVNDSELSFNMKDTGWLGVIGGDFRHYQKIHRQIIWANRFSFASSFGKKKVVYFLGGVDNWLSFSGSIPDKKDRRFDNNTPIDPQGNANYAFQALTPNLRGFKYNVRNGSNYGLVNSEIRIPLFLYLAKRQLRSQFLRHFQIVGFADIGTAWEVGNPFTEENRYFTYTYPDVDAGNSPVSVEVQYFKNPIVVGYGAGIRSSLLGFYLKLDRAWGIDSGRRNDGFWYLSLGTDF